MADNENHIDTGSAIGTLSPQSPENCSLPNTPISLDFDPMSFKLKESSPTLSPTDETVNNGLTQHNGVQGNPLDLDYFETLNTASQDKPLIDGLGNQPDIISSSVLKSQEGIDFEDSGPHSPSNDLLQFTTSNVVSESNATVSTESTLYSETESKQCVLTTVTTTTTTTTSKNASLIELSDEAHEEEECGQDVLHEISHEQHESIDVDMNEEVHSSPSVTAVLDQADILSQDTSLAVAEETVDENMRKSTTSYKQECKVVSETVSVKKEVSTKSYNEMNGKHEKLLSSRNADLSDEEMTECPISVARLRSQYVHQAEQNVAQSPPKEVIDTGIDLESLRTSYSQHANDRSVSPGRETIATGIDIKTLKTSLSKPQAIIKPKDQEVIETSISVKSLKSSFNQAQDFYPSAPVEEVKLSIDKDQLTRRFSQDQHGTGKEDVTSLCKICGKHVYQMEKIFAEKNAFHKSCFRCKECGKSLNVDTYFSNEGEIYCSPHFKLLFQPKARFEEEAEQTSKVIDEMDSEEGSARKPDNGISESTPVELPPDVVRSDTKAADGLESIPALSNIRSWFESPQEEQHHSVSDCTLQRSESILARMAKYQQVASGEQENGHLSPEEEVDSEVTVTKYKSKEKVTFSEMSSLKNQWESGSVTTYKEGKLDEQREELSKLRQHTKSSAVKTIYEKACQEATRTIAPRSEPDIELGEDISARSIKEKFEKGVIVNEIVTEKQERKEKDGDLSIFSEGGSAHGARNMFKQIDAAGAKAPLPSAKSPSKSPGGDTRRTREVLYCNQTSVDPQVVKCTTSSEKEVVESIEVSERFKFFENYKCPPCDNSKESHCAEPDAQRDPNIVRSSDVVDDIPVTDTTRRMLDKFKALESSTPERVTPVAPKQVKHVAPSRDFVRVEDNEYSNEPERDPNIIKASYKCDDDIVIEADKARSLKAKFENWESEVIRENKKNEDDDYLPQADIAKNLRAKFESIKDDASSAEKPKSKINRFIQEQTAASKESCDICGRRLYPMEKMETSGQKLHKNCFRCAHCSCILRLENYTTSAGRLYCTPHFKQLFISRGNYDEGFGREQHKEKWNRSRSNTPVLRDLSQNGDASEYTNGETKSLLHGSFDQVMA